MNQDELDALQELDILQEELHSLETTVQEMQWERVSLSPSQPEVQALDQQLPAEWLQPLEREAAFTQEEVQALLNAPLDIPEGDIRREMLHVFLLLHYFSEKAFYWQQRTVCS